MENGRIEPLRAPSMHQEAQPRLQPPQWAKQKHYIDFPLDGNTLNPTPRSLKRRPCIFSLLPKGRLGGPGPKESSLRPCRTGVFLEF